MNNVFSKILVTLQFSFIIAIIGASHWIPRSGAAQFILLVSLFLGLWAIQTMRLSNVRIMPEPKFDAVFIQTGPYKFIRHPMYLSVLLFTLGYVIEKTNPITIVCWFLLFITLHVKISYEENLLKQKFPLYMEYSRQSKRLIPFIY
ncbi:MAG: isoprenylcysteine carboxylmethyltransferase family protein [Bacteroidetes bacterium]|nr:isoprenylcysteine carboxylmethyltransferase family protein [Bacteroidota bacterium]